MNETVKSASIVNSAAAYQNSNIIWQHKSTKEYDKSINHESANTKLLFWRHVSILSLV